MTTAKFDDRLKRLMDAAGARSDSELARALDIQPQSIAAARKRQQIPGGWVEAIAEKYSASADWLLFGDPSGKSAAELRGLSLGRHPDQLGFTPTGPRGMDIPTVGTQAAPVVAPNGMAFVECMDCQLAMVPMVEARLSAGTGSFEVGETSERRYAFRMDFLTRKGQPSSMVLMRVDGDSMEPQIFNNDVVLVDQSQTTPRAGGLFAVGVEDVVYIKMVDTLPGKIVLKSYNEAYAPLEIDARGDLADGIRIIGRAVWVGRELY